MFIGLLADRGHFLTFSFCPDRIKNRENSAAVSAASRAEYGAVMSPALLSKT